MFKRIDHVEIVTDQLEKTEQFYTDVLGFTVKARDRVERSGLGVPIDLVYLNLRGTVVELISSEGDAVEPAPRNEHLGYRMIALEVDDMPEGDRLFEGQRCRGRMGPESSRDVFRGRRSATRTAIASSSGSGSLELLTSLGPGAACPIDRGETSDDSPAPDAASGRAPIRLHPAEASRRLQGRPVRLLAAHLDRPPHRGRHSRPQLP
jgi:catechol 2,3-dioxygenase-like lactoylglutathione lyase family enzyme